jgi:hypothetical protein
MIGACRLNNKSMRNIRRNEIYQCLAIDLAMLGVISKEECEMLIGSGIPNNLLLPNGKSGELVSENNLPKQPDFIQTEPEVTTPDASTITTDSGDVSPTEDKPDVQPEPIPGVTEMPGDETQEPVNDEGRTESDN